MSVGMIIMDKRLFLVSFIGLAGKVSGRTKLQKMIFLGQEEHSLGNTFDFQLYHYGPYSFDLNKTLSEVIIEGLVTEETVFSDTTGPQYSYSLTSEGKKFFETNKNTANMQAVLDNWENKSYSEIINYVYDKYVK